MKEEDSLFRRFHISAAQVVPWNRDSRSTLEDEFYACLTANLDILVINQRNVLEDDGVVEGVDVEGGAGD